MTARVVIVAGRVYVEADLADFQLAGHFLGFRGTALKPVRMGHSSPAEARRLAGYINHRLRARDDLAASRAYGEAMERAGQ